MLCIIDAKVSFLRCCTETGENMHINVLSGSLINFAIEIYMVWNKRRDNSPFKLEFGTT
jgi:hypothetical protein